jgi:SAM-dependent methyltransferase
MNTSALSPARIAPRLWPATILPVFASTLFLSAGLMFLVEPMVAKMVLPRLGGAAAVWSTCLVFFQTMLLLGYAYAHLSTRLLPRRAQVILHVCVLLPLSAAVLPLALGAGAPPAEQSPVLWLLLRLTLACGAPVFVISATAPLLQQWFADADHKGAQDPYFLYAVSNSGSLLALLAYPLIVEPELPLDLQATLWSVGFGLLSLGIVLCAAITLSHNRPRVSVMVSEPRISVSARDRIMWMVLAFIPSSLLLGVTEHITVDITSAPLLWVVPLTLYLLTFIFAFARRPPLPHAIMGRALPIMLIPMAISAGAMGSSLFKLALNLACFFVIAMVCHGELAKRRPPAAQLTEFYFFLSLGGVLGGVFNALVAPLIFQDVWEYPLALVAACLVKPRTPEDEQRNVLRDIALPLMLLAVVLLSRSFLLGTLDSKLGLLSMAFVYVLPGLALLNFSRRRWRFSFAVALLLFVPLPQASKQIASERSFFGVYRIDLVSDANTQALALMNGTTLHGVKSLLPDEARLPMAYYSKEGSFGRFFNALPQGSVRRVAVVGLGTGGLACYAKEGQDWTFYEIDPVVARIARDSRYFQFLSNCGNDSHVVLGDARVTIGNAPDSAYDVLIIDAFSSDSVPVHLLTREALALYLRKLAPGGRVLFHISSRTLNLAPVIAALAADAGVPARVLSDSPPAETPVWRRSPALVVAVAGRGGDLGYLTTADDWKELPPAKPQFLWTDQRADLLRVINFGL